MAITVKLSVRTYVRSNGEQYFQYKVGNPTAIWKSIEAKRGTPVTLTIGDTQVPLFDCTEDSLQGWGGTRKDPAPELCASLAKVGVAGKWVGFSAEAQVEKGTTHGADSGLAVTPVDSPF